MIFKHLTKADYKTTPWKNGKGITTEIAIHPAGATLENFEWRVSSAGVTEAGPFSKFSGFTRDLIVLEGEGLVLENRGAEKSLPQFEVHRFDGGEETSCRLIGGAVRDFNVIFRKERVAVTTEVIRSSHTKNLPEGTWIMFCASDEATLRKPAEFALKVSESVVFDVEPGESQEFKLEGASSTCILVHMDARR